MNHHKPAWKIVFEELQQELLGGEFRPGESLPPIKSFALQRRVSDHTVRKAYNQLISAGLLYRSGRGFFAGQPPSPLSVPNLQHKQPNVLLILHTDENSWSRVFHSLRTRDFARTFTEEAGRFGFQMTPVFVYPVKHSSLLISGMDQIDAYLDSLGMRYHGTLIVGESYHYYRRSMGENLLLKYIPWLCQKKKPVVWFDSINNLTANTVPVVFKNEYQNLLKIRNVNKNFTRIYLDEENAVMKAVSLLWRRGHRRFGYVHIGQGQDKWVSVRKQMIQNALKSLSEKESFELHCKAHSPDISNDTQNTEWLKNLMKKWSKTKGITAWIAPNDKGARIQYLALRYCGFDIPGQMSLISFDSDPGTLFPWPVSSINMGFSSMGQQALQRFTVSKTEPGSGKQIDCPSMCRLNHYDSLGPGVSP